MKPEEGVTDGAATQVHGAGSLQPSHISLDPGELSPSAFFALAREAAALLWAGYPPDTWIDDLHPRVIQSLLFSPSRACIRMNFFLYHRPFSQVLSRSRACALDRECCSMCALLWVGTRGFFFFLGFRGVSLYFAVMGVLFAGAVLFLNKFVMSSNFYIIANLMLFFHRIKLWWSYSMNNINYTWDITDLFSTLRSTGLFCFSKSKRLI